MSHKIHVSESGQTTAAAPMASLDPDGILHEANDQLIKSLTILHDKYLTSKEHLSDAAKMAMLQVDQGAYINLKYPPSSSSQPGSVVVPCEENLFEIRLAAMYLSEIASSRQKSGGRALHAAFDTGYFTACLAIMLGEKGQVFAIDPDEQVVDKSIKSFEQNNPELLTSGRVTFFVGDGSEGFPQHGPYDVMAMCVQLPSVLPTILNQLNPGGILIATVGDLKSWSVQKITKDLNGQVTTTILKKKVPVCGLELTGFTVADFKFSMDKMAETVAFVVTLGTNPNLETTKMEASMDEA